MTGTTVSSAGLDPRRRRLLYRFWHRGTREVDLVMGRFLDVTITTLSEAEVDELEELVDVPDPELYAWIAGSQMPDHASRHILRRLREFYAQRTPGSPERITDRNE